MNVTVSREAHFNAAHRLYRKDWSDAQNSEVFGKCSLPNYHGHNYRLIVSVTGDIDPSTGFVMDMKNIKQLIRREVEERYDHRNLNLDTEDFKELNPTAENIALTIYHRLKSHIDPQLKLSITLYETERNFVSCGD